MRYSHAKYVLFSYKKAMSLYSNACEKNTQSIECFLFKLNKKCVEGIRNVVSNFFIQISSRQEFSGNHYHLKLIFLTPQTPFHRFALFFFKNRRTASMRKRNIFFFFISVNILISAELVSF